MCISAPVPVWLITLISALGSEGVLVVPDVVSVPRKEKGLESQRKTELHVKAYGYMIPRCLLNVDNNIVIKPALCSWRFCRRQSWFGLKTQHRIRISLALWFGEVAPVLLMVVVHPGRYLPFFASHGILQRAIALRVLFKILL